MTSRLEKQIAFLTRLINLFTIHFGTTACFFFQFGHVILLEILCINKKSWLFSLTLTFREKVLTFFCNKTKTGCVCENSKYLTKRGLIHWSKILKRWFYFGRMSHNKFKVRTAKWQKKTRFHIIRWHDYRNSKSGEFIMFVGDEPCKSTIAAATATMTCNVLRVVLATHFSVQIKHMFHWNASIILSFKTCIV